MRTYKMESKMKRVTIAADVLNWTMQRIGDAKGAHFGVISLPEEYIQEKLDEIETLRNEVKEAYHKGLNDAGKHIPIDEHYEAIKRITETVNQIRDERDKALAQLKELSEER